MRILVIVVATVSFATSDLLNAQECGSSTGVTQGMFQVKCHLPPDGLGKVIGDSTSEFLRRAKVRETETGNLEGPETLSDTPTWTARISTQRNTDRSTLQLHYLMDPKNNAEASGGIGQFDIQDMNNPTTAGMLQVSGNASIEFDQNGIPTSPFDYARSYSREAVSYDVVNTAGNAIRITPGRLSYSGGARANKSWNHLRDPVVLYLEETNGTGELQERQETLFETNFDFAVRQEQITALAGVFDAPQEEGVPEGFKPEVNWNGTTVDFQKALADLPGLPGYWDVTLGSENLDLFGINAPHESPMGDTLRIRFSASTPPVAEVATGVFECLPVQGPCETGTYNAGNPANLSNHKLDLSIPFGRAGIVASGTGLIRLPYQEPLGYKITKIEVSAEAIAESYFNDATQFFSTVEPNAELLVSDGDNLLKLVNGGAPFAAYFSGDSAPGVQDSTNLGIPLDDYDGEFLLTTGEDTLFAEPNGVAINYAVGDDNQVNGAFNYKLAPSQGARNAIEFRLVPECNVEVCDLAWFNQVGWFPSNQQPSPSQGIGLRMENGCDDCDGTEEKLTVIGGSTEQRVQTSEEWQQILFRIEKDPLNMKARFRVWKNDRNIGSLVVDEDISYSAGSMRMAFAGAGEYGNTIDDIVGLGKLVLAEEKGDLNGDGIVDALDLDTWAAATQMQIRTVDFNSDGQFNLQDRVFLVENLIGTFLGDTDLDGEVGFADFLTISANFLQPGGWANGDIDGNGLIEAADFESLRSNFGSKVTAAAVPEPSGNLLAFLGLVLVLLLRVTRGRSSCWRSTRVRSLHAQRDSVHAQSLHRRWSEKHLQTKERSAFCHHSC